MTNESKLFFWDAGGKFKSVKEQTYDKCRLQYNLTVYSLTPKGEKKPTRLIMVMTPTEYPDGYLSVLRPDVKEAKVSMLSLDYQMFPAESLPSMCSHLASTFASKTTLNCNKGCAALLEYSQGIHATSVADFFRIDPREDEPGAQIYLRDKAHFRRILSNPEKPAFCARSLLMASEKENLKYFDMSHADIGEVLYVNSLFSLFKGYKNLRELDVSTLDTTHIIDMSEMFHGCQSLRRLDLSTFDFSHVSYLKNMFAQCPNLEEVILSDTILQVGHVPHGSPRSYTAQELNEMSRWTYITEGPQRAAMVVDRAADSTTHDYVPIGQATDEEVREYLGFPRDHNVKLTIVPHRDFQKISKTESTKPEPEPKPEFFIPKPVYPNQPIPRPADPAAKSSGSFASGPRSYEEKQRVEQKKINFWAWIIAIAAFLAIALIALRFSD